MVNILHSRIHSLQSYATTKAKVWVKREDELGFGVSGCKKRKYLSLLSYILAQKFEKVALIGGENSNNVQAFLQLLNEHKIPTILYIKQQKNPVPKGNSFLLKLLAKPQTIRYVDAEEWENVNELAQKELEKQGISSFFVVPEGASCAQSIEGLATLMEDVAQNETENDVFFDHIFVDSGTAITSAVLGYCNAQKRRKTQIHVVHIAGNQALFEQQWQGCNDFYQTLIPVQNIVHHRPFTAKSFGSTNATIWREVYALAQEEGILTDPVYTAKLFHTARQTIQNQEIIGNVLIIHSGGGTGLMGFA